MNELFKLSEARFRLFSSAPPAHVLRRWIKKGLNGVFLEATRAGTQNRPTYYLTQNAVNRFFDRVAQVSVEALLYKKKDSRSPEQKAAAAAVDRMKKRGWF